MAPEGFDSRLQPGPYVPPETPHDPARRGAVKALRSSSLPRGLSVFHKRAGHRRSTRRQAPRARNRESLLPGGERQDERNSGNAPCPGAERVPQVGGTLPIDTPAGTRAGNRESLLPGGEGQDEGNSGNAPCPGAERVPQVGGTPPIDTPTGTPAGNRESLLPWGEGQDEGKSGTDLEPRPEECGSGLRVLPSGLRTLSPGPQERHATPSGAIGNGLGRETRLRFALFVEIFTGVQ
jgi:hypothetical protein